MSDDPVKHVYMQKVAILAARGLEPAGVLLRDPREPLRIAAVTFEGKVMWLFPTGGDEPET